MNGLLRVVFLLCIISSDGVGLGIPRIYRTCITDS